MNPERSVNITDSDGEKHRVEEFYRHGEFVVYIDNQLTDYSYEDAIKNLKEPK